MCLDFALYPFAVINNSCDYILGPVNPPSESSNPGALLGTPNIVRMEKKLRPVQSEKPGDLEL